MANMYYASFHLLIAVFLVLTGASKNETTNTAQILTNTTTGASNTSMPLDNSTVSAVYSVDTTSVTRISTVTLPNITVKNITSANVSDSPTPSTLPEHPTATADLHTKKTANPTSKIQTTTNKGTTSKESGATYIVILIIIVLCIVVILVYCCFQKKNRRYSVDLHPKQEDAQIPLSTVDAEVFDPSVKDLQTFAPVESSVPLKDPEPVQNPEKSEEIKDTPKDTQENLSNSQAILIPEDKVEELTIVDLTDGEPAISTKTSMESLDEPLNENNSNNTGAEVHENGYAFTKISLDGKL